MTKSKKLLLGFAALGIFVGGVAFAQTITRDAGAPLTRFDFTETHEPQSPATGWCVMSVDTYEDVPGLIKTFQLGGFLPQEVLVTFHAQTNPQDLDTIRLLIDDQVQPGSGSGIAISNPSQGISLEEWTFASAPLDPGIHIAKVQMKSQSGGGVACLYSRSMTILHR